MTSGSKVTARRIEFAYPPDMGPVWTPAKPEFSCAANAVSLMMPVMEPYFVRSIAAALPDLDEPLRSETEAYLAQEAQHHRQHRRFNRVLVDRYRWLAPLEHLMRRVYRSVERRASPQFNIAFAAGSETIAYSAARWAARHRTELFAGADEVASTLFLWHLAEEVEHKSAAHDVYWSRYGGRRGARLRYSAATALTVALVVLFVIAGTTIMAAGERRLHRPMAWLRLVRWSIGFAFELLPNLVWSMLPSHHPSDFTDPLWYEVWLRELDGDTGTLPLWHLIDMERSLDDGPEPGSAPELGQGRSLEELR